MHLIINFIEWVIAAFIFIFAAVYACKHIVGKFKQCKHEWVEGRGYIKIGNHTETYYDGPRCLKCRECKNAPWIVEVP